jgi:hypothetical protein
MPALDFWKVYISMSQNFMIITKTITGNISQYIRDHDWARNPVLNQPIFHGMTQGIWAWEVSWGLAHRDLSRHSDLPSFAEMTVENKVHGFQPHKFGQGTGKTFTFVYIYIDMYVGIECMKCYYICIYTHVYNVYTV